MNFLDELRDQARKPVARETVVLDGAEIDIESGAASFEMQAIRTDVAAVIAQFAEETGDDGDELVATLDGMFIGLADADKDGELTDDESAFLDVVYTVAADYLARQGVPEEDISGLLNDGDGDAAINVRDYLADALPQEDAADEDALSFAFDSAVMDAAYKNKMVMRGGKKMRVRKRISGFVRLSSAQKNALRKARLKSHSASARMKRLKSVKRGRAMGLYK